MSSELDDSLGDDTPSPSREGGMAGERIAKVLARAGLCSRRDAEKMIAAHRVAVNGTVLTSPAFNVAAKDRVCVDGEPLRTAQQTRLWRYHKPPGLVTTHKDTHARPAVFDVLPRDMPRVVSVGRLDLNSQGLLLLTNNGALAGLLEHPTTGWARCYRVRVHGWVESEKLSRLADGVEIDGIRYGPLDARIDHQQGTNCWLQVTLHEGKNREIRRLMEHVGLTVNRLIRLSYGPFMIGRLQKGEVEEVPLKSLRAAVRGLGKAVPADLRTDTLKTAKWAKAKPRPVRPGHKKGGGFADGGGQEQARSPKTHDESTGRDSQRRRDIRGKKL